LGHSVYYLCYVYADWSLVIWQLVVVTNCALKLSTWSSSVYLYIRCSDVTAIFGHDRDAISGAARGEGESSPLWLDVQKLCNMCVLSLSWNFFVSHDKYIARPSSKEPR